MRDSDEHTEDQYFDHMKRIERIITAWQNGEISMGKKRESIATENEIYYGGAFKSPATGLLITPARRSRS